MILPDWSTVCILEGYQVKLTYFKNFKQVQEVHNELTYRQNSIYRFHLLLRYENKKAQLSLTNPRDVKVCQNRRAYNVVADDTGLSSFVQLLLCPKSAKSREIY